MSQFPENVLTNASDLRLDILLECPDTQDAVIRFICTARKALMEAPALSESMDVIEAERLLNRLYHGIGFERRNSAFSGGSRAAAAA